MSPTTSLLPLLFIAVSLGGSVTATPPPSLGLITHMKPRQGINIADADRARAIAMIGSNQNGRTSFPIKDTAFIYSASVGVGVPPTHYNLLVDTGSSNTWLGAGKAYHRTSTSKSTGQTVAVRYGSGNFSGEEFLDTVTLSPELVIKSQSIGVANASAGIEPFDGILGLGPLDLTNGTINNSSKIVVPTVTDNLYQQGVISIDLVGIAFAPTTLDNVNTTNGNITFGATDPNGFIGDIEYVPITKTRNSTFFWGFNQSISYGSTPILENGAGIVDTGTTLLMLQTKSFNTYVNLTGAKMNNKTGLLEITNSQYKNLKSLDFKIGNEVFSLTPNGQLWPRSLNTAINGTNDSLYLIIGDMGNGSTDGMTFINGMTFLQRFYSVYDTTNSRIGFAPTRYTFATSN